MIFGGGGGRRGGGRCSEKQITRNYRSSEATIQTARGRTRGPSLSCSPLADCKRWAGRQRAAPSALQKKARETFALPHRSIRLCSLQRRCYKGVSYRCSHDNATALPTQATHRGEEAGHWRTLRCLLSSPFSARKQPEICEGGEEDRSSVGDAKEGSSERVHCRMAVRISAQPQALAALKRIGLQLIRQARWVGPPELNYGCLMLRRRDGGVSRVASAVAA